MNQKHKHLAQISLITLLILGCLSVLYPFLVAILFAAVICVTTWPFYLRLCRFFGNRNTAAAAWMTLILIFGMLAPTILLTIGLHDTVLMTVDTIGHWLKTQNGNINDLVVTRLKELPYMGDQAIAYWQKISGNREEVQKLLHSAYAPVRNFAFSTIFLVGNGILQLTLVIFICFFFYRDGATLSRTLANAAERLGGNLGSELLTLSRSTITGVMIGIVGTALAQALVAMIGFIIAGVPGVILLTMATFFLSMVPVGPPLIWGGAAFWLYSQGETGWAIFMMLYGLLVISSVDNFVKPILISRNSSLPILLIALGVFGGVLAFGFIGIFLGPTLLALGDALFKRWMTDREGAARQEVLTEGAEAQEETSGEA